MRLLSLLTLPLLTTSTLLLDPRQARPSSITELSPSASSASMNTDQVTLSATASGANPSDAGSRNPQTASVAETQISVELTSTSSSASATAAAETGDSATRPMGNGMLAGMGLLAWLMV